jgi:hypothetical protein
MIRRLGGGPGVLEGNWITMKDEPTRLVTSAFGHMCFADRPEGVRFVSGSAAA